MTINSILVHLVSPMNLKKERIPLPFDKRVTYKWQAVEPPPVNSYINPH
jgi:hypothetical protein